MLTVKDVADRAGALARSLESNPAHSGRILWELALLIHALASHMVAKPTVRGKK